MAYLTLITGLLISAVAIYYSVAGLATIFSAALIPIIIMGSVLEAAKLVVTVWLKQNWTTAPRFLKSYLLGAVVILMIITSMGIFGFLSKAHLDQTLISGDVVDKVAIIDEKIKTQKDTIEAARKALRQLDESVDQTMARSTSEQGADKAANLRRAQQRERTQLQNDISKAQSAIAKLNEERAPIAKELRAVEAEVGPIKYIAKLIYGDKPDTNILEKAVTWVIILIVVVFDPLAIMLLLASQYSFAWSKKKKEEIESDIQKKDDQDKVEEVPVTNLDVVAEEVAEVLPEAVEVNKQDNWPKASAMWPFPRPEADVQPLNTSTVEYKVLDDIEDEEFAYPYESTQTQTIIEEQPIDPDKNLTVKELIEKYGYSEENGIVKLAGKDYTSDEFRKLLDDGYVQNEEQAESGVWSKIVNKTITEEEYLNQAQKRQNKKEE